MDINDIRKIGERLKREIPSHLEELRRGSPIGKGASGDITHPIDKRAEDIVIEEAEKFNTPLTIMKNADLRI
jgi:fructose-1,6-bisphosphatase/inositol monophosphatase family enzyme